MKEFEDISRELLSLIPSWENKFSAMGADVITERYNSQGRHIKQILGHMIDSASNNTHRIVHLQYRESPCDYPNYASNGNNDRWIAIQDYQSENWIDMIQLWKYSNLHIVHVIGNVDSSKLETQWIYDENNLFTLREMIVDYLRHFKLHLDEIDELLSR